MPELRIITLYDDETIFLVKTNAPEEEIHKALDHRTDMLINDDPAFRSDFEEIQEYLQNKGYQFESLGYVEEIEGYYW